MGCPLKDHIEDAARLATEATLGKTALGTTLAGSMTAVVGRYTLNDWAIIIGVIAAIGGLLVQIIVQYNAYRIRTKEERRAEEEEKRALEWHATRMAAIAHRLAEKTHGDTEANFDEAASIFDDSAKGGL